MIVYFDTSALIKQVFEESGSDLPGELWDAGDRLVSTQIAYPEARAAAAAAHRAGRIGSDDLRDANREIDLIFDELELVGVDAPLVREAGDLAEGHGLRGYDAVHLASALSIDAPRLVVATWEVDLAGAASPKGLAVVPSHRG